MRAQAMQGDFSERLRLILTPGATLELFRNRNAMTRLLEESIGPSSPKAAGTAILSAHPLSYNGKATPDAKSPARGWASLWVMGLSLHPWLP